MLRQIINETRVYVSNVFGWKKISSEIKSDPEDVTKIFEQPYPVIKIGSENVQISYDIGQDSCRITTKIKTPYSKSTKGLIERNRR
jgi:hypothetical protein